MTTEPPRVPAFQALSDQFERAASKPEGISEVFCVFENREGYNALVGVFSEKQKAERWIDGMVLEMWRFRDEISIMQFDLK